MKKYFTILAGLILSTYSSLAQQQITPAYLSGPQRPRGQYRFDFDFFRNFIGESAGLVSMLPALLMGVAVVLFFFYLIKYLITSKNDVAEKQKNLKALMYSLVAIFIMVTLWGIIAFFGDALGLNTQVKVFAPETPSIPRTY